MFLPEWERRSGKKKRKTGKTQRNKDGLQRDQGFGSEKTRPYDKNTWALYILRKNYSYVTGLFHSLVQRFRSHGLNEKRIRT